MRRRFLRKSKDKVMGGICSGLAEYVGADVTLIRLVTLFGIIASGIFPGLFFYLICLIVVPLDSHVDGGYNFGNSDDGNSTNTNYDNFQDDRGSNQTSNNARYILGIGLIIIGIFLFARMFFGWIRWEYVFAGMLILGGLFMVFGNNRRNG